MILMTQKDGCLSTHFDLLDEIEIVINISSIKQIL